MSDPAILGFTPVPLPHGALTIPQALDQLTDEAHDIVHGYIRSVRVEPHPQLRNLNTIVVTLSVKDAHTKERRGSHSSFVSMSGTLIPGMPALNTAKAKKWSYYWGQSRNTG